MNTIFVRLRCEKLLCSGASERLTSYNQSKPTGLWRRRTSRRLIFSPEVPDLSQISSEDVSERLPYISVRPQQKRFSLRPEFGLTYESGKFTTLRNWPGSLAISRREERAAFYKTAQLAESTRGINNIKQFKQPGTGRRHVAPKCLFSFNKCKA